MSLNSQAYLLQQSPTPPPSQSIQLNLAGSSSTKNGNSQRNNNANRKLFCSVTPYSQISQSLQEHIAIKSNGELIESSCSGFSTAINSLMYSSNNQNSPSIYHGSSAKCHAKSYAPSPATHFQNTSSTERGDSSESRNTQSSQYQFGEKSRREKNLELYHQEAFKFLMTLNTNLKKFKDAENKKKLKKQLNLDESSLSKSYFDAKKQQMGSRGDLTSTTTVRSIQSEANTTELYLKKSKAVLEKKNTVQTILASSFCKSYIFNRKKRALIKQDNSK